MPDRGQQRVSSVGGLPHTGVLGSAGRSVDFKRLIDSFFEENANKEEKADLDKIRLQAEADHYTLGGGDDSHSYTPEEQAVYAATIRENQVNAASVQVSRAVSTLALEVQNQEDFLKEATAAVSEAASILPPEVASDFIANHMATVNTAYAKKLGDHLTTERVNAQQLVLTNWGVLDSKTQEALRSGNFESAKVYTNEMRRRVTASGPIDLGGSGVFSMEQVTPLLVNFYENSVVSAAVHGFHSANDKTLYIMDFLQGNLEESINQKLDASVESMSMSDELRNRVLETLYREMERQDALIKIDEQNQRNRTEHVKNILIAQVYDSLRFWFPGENLPEEYYNALENLANEFPTSGFDVKHNVLNSSAGTDSYAVSGLKYRIATGDLVEPGSNVLEAIVALDEKYNANVVNQVMSWYENRESALFSDRRYQIILKHRIGHDFPVREYRHGLKILGTETDLEIIKIRAKFLEEFDSILLDRFQNNQPLDMDKLYDSMIVRDEFKIPESRLGVSRDAD